jgi:NAD(P)-dependent dehydrogenase (short-subunit alcohol dehydrogenase family)/pimeloyl-ACP methyl ester carboxylesterase
MTTAPTQSFVRNGDISLAVYEQGNLDGPTIVLVHGWPDSHNLWEFVAPLLADEFRVISYDSRGAGASSKPTKVADYKLSELTKDFYAVIDAVSPDDPVHVLAHDWGSIGMWEAVSEAKAEERIASFTSVSGPNLDYIGRWTRNGLVRPTPRNLLGPLSQLGSSWYTGLMQIPILPEYVLKNAVSKVWPQLLRLYDGIDPDRVRVSEGLASDMALGANLYRANIGPRLAAPRYRPTSVPVQLVVNKKDRAVRSSGYSGYGQFARNLWRRDVESGHWLPLGRPELLASMTKEFIAMLGGEAPSMSLRRAKVGPERAEFTDELVVVTGAGSGIGRETARAFARLGAHVAVADIDLETAKETVATIENEGGIASAHQVNVAVEQEVKEFAANLKNSVGVPSVLVNNAGIGLAGPFLETSSEDFDRVLSVNLDGVVYGCRHFGRQMADNGEGGHIVNISSLAAFTPQKILSAYATSKAAVYMLSNCLRAELAPAGVGVTAICPGIVATNITATTEFAGLSPVEQAAKQNAVTARYRRRNYTPDRVANEIVRAVRKNRAVVSVTPEAKIGRLVAQIAPPVTRFSAKISVF